MRSTTFIAAVFVPLLLAATSPAAVIRPGVFDARADLGMEVPVGDYDVPPVSLGLGYFPAPNLEAGVLLGYRKMGWDSYWRNSGVWELGLFGEYHLDVNFPLHPHAGVRISLLDGDESSDTVGQLLIYSGVKYFLSEYVALAANIGVALATDSIFDVTTKTISETEVRSEGGDSVGLFLSVGIRYYY